MGRFPHHEMPPSKEATLGQSSSEELGQLATAAFVDGEDIVNARRNTVVDFALQNRDMQKANVEFTRSLALSNLAILRTLQDIESILGKDNKP